MPEFEFAIFPELTSKGRGIFRCPDTGRLIVYGYADENQLRSIEQTEAFKQRQRRLELMARSRGRNFVVCPDDRVRELSQKLKLNELGALIRLLPYLQLRREGLLVRDGENMTIEDIMRVIGKQRRMTTTILNRLEEEGVFIKGGSRRAPSYSISNNYHWMGTVEDGVTFTKLYQVESRLKMDKLSIQDAGLLYKLLPYFHRDTYILSANPNERDVELIDPLSHEQLSLLIGEDPRGVRTHMNNLVKHFFVKKSMSGGAVIYEVNPDIMFRDRHETEYTQVIRSQFAALEKASKMA